MQYLSCFKVLFVNFLQICFVCIVLSIPSKPQAVDALFSREDAVFRGSGESPDVRFGISSQIGLNGVAS